MGGIFFVASCGLGDVRGLSMSAKTQNPVLWSQKDHPKPDGFNANGEVLIEAVRSGDEQKVREALIKGAPIDYVCQAPTNPPIYHIGSMTALMLAAHRGDQAVVQLLLDKKASKTVENHLRRKAVDYAKEDKLKALLAE